MTRFFNILKSATKSVGEKQFVDEEKVKELPVEDKDFMCKMLAGSRQPIVSAFVTENTESWLHSMGYLYTKKGEYCTFKCTAEHEVR